MGRPMPTLVSKICIIASDSAAMRLPGTNLC